MRGRAASVGIRWLPWVAGAAALAAVVVAARHFADERDFVRILERASPWWLLAAVALQLLTYAAQAQVWRIVARARGALIDVGVAYELSLAKLFVDQALPSGGISGTILFARALGQRGMPGPVIGACVVVDGAMYYASYFVCLAVATALVILGGFENGAVLAFAAVFLAFAAAVSVVMLRFAGRSVPPLLRRLDRFAVVKRALDLVESVDGGLVRDPRLLVRAGACHVAIVLLDAGTMWLLVLALGLLAPPSAVFASFMLSTLLRTIGVLPGGLGTFEATSVITLKLAGIPVAVALSATLAFRLLSFWLPMVPGLVFSRSMTRAARAPTNERAGTLRASNSRGRAR